MNWSWLATELTVPLSGYSKEVHETGVQTADLYFLCGVLHHLKTAKGPEAGPGVRDREGRAKGGVDRRDMFAVCPQSLARITALWPFVGDGQTA